MRERNGSARSAQAVPFDRYDDLVANEKRQKTSADLIKEARDRATGSRGPSTDQPVRPPIIRPSDRIAPSYVPPTEPAEAQAPANSTEPTRTRPAPTRRSSRLPSVPASTGTAMPTAAPTGVKDIAASILNGIGWLMIVVALGLAVLLVIAAFADYDQIGDLLIGGVAIVLFPLALGIGLIAAGRRRRRAVAAKAQADRATAPATAPAPPTGSQPSRAAAAGVRDGEAVLASITGVPDGATSGSAVGVIVAAAIIFIIFSALTGFGSFFLIAGVIFLIARSIKKAGGAAGSVGRMFPGAARLTITDQRVLMTVRSWAPNTPETHMERPVTQIDRFKAATGNKASVRIVFTDGEEVKMSTSVTNAEQAERALEAVTA